MASCGGGDSTRRRMVNQSQLQLQLQRRSAATAMGLVGMQPCSASDERDLAKMVVPVPKEFRANAWIQSRQQYEEMYKQSIEDPSSFWGKLASEFHWERKWDTSQPVCRFNFDLRKGPVHVEWFNGGYTNICYNALDKHVKEGRGDKVAILWEGNEVGHELQLTYKDVLQETCKLANYLRKRGVRKGDRVCIYMAMVPQLPIAMLACARIGAIHSVVFGGFSAESLAGRILDCKASVLLSCSAVKRGSKGLDLKKIVDGALELCLRNENFQPGTCLVFDNANAVPRHKVNWVAGRDLWWQDEVESCSTEAAVEWMEAEDPLFLLYTSGSTGKPKGVLHTVGGYMVYAAATFKYVFDYRPGDIYWCTADSGWITGHTYGVYGPFLNGATQVVFEGMPMYPSPSRWWQIIEKYKVSLFYTAPTAIRSLEAAGDKHVMKHSRSSLRVLGTAGEAINAKAWQWYHRVVGEGRCPIVDTWWQTETGGIMITPLPGAWAGKPGSATLPFFGVQPVVVDAEGKELQGPCSGSLCIKGAWPGMARTLYGDHQRFEQVYFATWPGLYVTGDGCQREANGFITLTGREDDVVNVSGHRISIGEVESALTSHRACAETAAVAFDHNVKGQGIYAFVTLVEGASPTEKLKNEIKAAVKREIGSFAVPDVIQWAPGLPKTRSGKIMRRILRKIAANKFDDLGDVSSLADPTVVEQLVETKRGSSLRSRL